MRYRLDPTLRRLGDGRVVLGGSPLKLMRLTEAGARWVRRAADGDDIAPNTLLDRLVDNGALHPSPTPADSPFTTADITVVIPTRNGDVHDLLAALYSKLGHNLPSERWSERRDEQGGGEAKGLHAGGMLGGISVLAAIRRRT